MKKIALITGLTGQDGSYLAKYLIQQNYQVIGLMRRISTEPPHRLRQQDLDKPIKSGQLILASGDVTDRSSIEKTLKKYRPNEIYNLAAQSHVAVSFQQPEETIRTNLLGPLNILEATKTLELATKVYQASTSEMFGDSAREFEPQDENTPFLPCSPYGTAKLAAHHLMRIARVAEQNFPIPTACGILFNHESPFRGQDFVTRKITKALARIYYGKQDVLELGNLAAERDWGFAGDYVKAMHLMLQQKGEPQDWQDFVIASGAKHSVRDFVEAAFSVVGWQIKWEGEGKNEKGYVNNKLRIAINPAFFREKEVWTLRGNSAKAKELLGWAPETSFEELVEMMVKHDLEEEK